MIRAIQHVSRNIPHRFARNLGFPFWSLVSLIRGTFHFHRSGERDIVVKAPVFFLCKPNSPYSLTTGEEETVSEELYALFTPADHWDSLLRWPFSPGGMMLITVPQKPLAQQVLTTLHEACRIWQNQPHRHPELAANQLERALLLLDAVNPQHQHFGRDARIHKALAYIRANYSREITVPELARHSGLSPSRFAHLFRAQTNLTPKQQLELMRLDVAAERLLISTDPVEEIGYFVGFSNPAHFSTRFKKRFKHSPRNYRSLHLHP